MILFPFMNAPRALFFSDFLSAPDPSFTGTVKAATISREIDQLIEGELVDNYSDSFSSRKSREIRGKLIL